MTGSAKGNMAGNKLKQILVAAVSVSEVYDALSKVKSPAQALKAIIKRLGDLLDRQAKTGQEIGEDELKGVRDALKKLKSPPAEVGVALKILKELLGEDVPPKAAGKSPALANFLDKLKMPPLGNIPVYSQGKVQASVKPGMWRARLIKSGRALDGKIWPAEVLRAAVERGLFEGRPVNAIVFQGKYGDIENHLPDDVPSGVVFGNTVGIISGSSFNPEDGSVYANLLITDPAKQALIEAMFEAGQDLPGLSIYATGSLADNNMVEAIDKVDSMDLVTFPAAEGRILSKALTASVTNFGALLKAADQPTPEAPSAPEAPNKPPEAADEAKKPAYSKVWLLAQARHFASDMLAGKPDPEGLQARLEQAVNQVAGDDYSGDKYPLNTMMELLQAVYNLIYGQEEPPQNAEAPAKQETKEEAPVNPGELAKQQALGGAQSMGFIGNAIAQQNERLRAIEARVNAVDTEAMVAEKLLGSGLPNPIVMEMARALKGKAVDERSVDEFIDFGKRLAASVGGNLARKASISIDGDPIGESNPTGSVHEAIIKMLRSKRG